jgi:hypothetical protein
MKRHERSAPILLLLFCLLGTRASAGERDAQGPLKDLPSKPGPHIEKIRALGDNSWLELGAPDKDPKWCVLPTIFSGPFLFHHTEP